MPDLVLLAEVGCWLKLRRLDMKNLSLAVTPEPVLAAEASGVDAISKPNVWLDDYRSGMLTNSTNKPKMVWKKKLSMRVQDVACIWLKLKERIDFNIEFNTLCRLHIFKSLLWVYLVIIMIVVKVAGRTIIIGQRALRFMLSLPFRMVAVVALTVSEK